ncbi:MAG: hypothetical protein HUJ65_00580, partial [Oscillospiraceae bacterium]|nr:hypothetical protein [Oscillospiraceae bacterium]
MELSMWMLADALADDIIAAEISDGQCVLQGVRIDCGITSENISVLSFDDSGRIVCTNGVDRLIFHAGDIASIANRILDVFDFYRAWERKTLELIRGGCSSAELARRFGELLNLSLFLADTTFYSYARYFSPVD